MDGNFETRTLGRSGLAVTRLGLGLAAVGRPAYITLGRRHDLPDARTPEVMYARSAELLDAAWAAGIRYVDVARSYGRAEEFLARWLGERRIAPASVTVGSKWGYRYTAGWAVDATVHEEKELSLARFEAQLAESRALLGDHLDLYEIHSATVESGVLGDRALLRALVDARRAGAYRAIGLTLTGAKSADTLRHAREAESGGERVFDVVQATFNILEPSLAPLLAAAHAEGMGVIVKEVHANGRLTDANERPEDVATLTTLREIARGLGADAVGVAELAVAFALAQSFVDVVLSGAATTAQLASHRAALTRTLDAATLRRVSTIAEQPAQYWSTRAALPWT